MEEKIAKRLISGEAVNLMGKLHDLSGKPGYYSFASGMPNECTFPVKEMSDAISDVLDNQWEEALQYNSTSDYLPLKQIIVERHRKEGLDVTTDDILITSSSTQALDICAKTLLDPGDYMLIERPTFMGAINTFKIYGSQLIDVPVSAGGVDIEALKMQLEKKPKMAYFIPTFQNPSPHPTVRPSPTPSAARTPSSSRTTPTASSASAARSSLRSRRSSATSASCSAASQRSSRPVCAWAGSAARTRSSWRISTPSSSSATSTPRASPCAA